MFSQTVEYSLRAAAILAADFNEDGPTLTPGKDIAERTQVPPRYLTKVLAVLVRAQLVHATRGVGGGYALARPPASIQLLDVINAVEPFERIERCPLKLPCHADRLCALHRRLDDAIAQAQAVLGNATLADLTTPADRNTEPNALEPCASLTQPATLRASDQT